MRTLFRTKAMAAAAVAGTLTATGAVVGLTADQAVAAEAVSRGVTGCVAYSYENGWASTTVYLHNRCDRQRSVTIYTGVACVDPVIRIKGGDYRTHRVWNCQVSDVGGG